MKKVWKGFAAAVSAAAIAATGFIGATSAHAVMAPGQINITGATDADTFTGYMPFVIASESTTGEGDAAVTTYQYTMNAAGGFTDSVVPEIINKVDPNSGITSPTTDAKVSEWVKAYFGADNGAGFAKDSTKAQSFAKAVIDVAEAKNLDPAFTNQTAAQLSAADSPAGYYAIKQTNEPATGTADTTTVSRYISGNVTAAAPLTVAIKNTTVTSVKKVQENDSNTVDGTTDTRLPGVNINNNFNDVADYSIGDDVPFEFIGTVPAKFGDYDHFQYIFKDTMNPAQLQLVEDSVQVYVLPKDVTNISWAADGSLTGGTLLTNGTHYAVSVDKNADDTQKGTFSIAVGTNVPATTEPAAAAYRDLKGITYGADNTKLAAGDRIVVTYKATLQQGAQIGRPGNVNTMELEFSNNPYDVYDTATTPKDEVVVFTYELDANKVDAGDHDVELTGAEFVLWKNDKGTENNQAANLVQAKDTEGNAIAGSYIFTGWAPAGTAGTTLKNENGSLFKIAGLDEGTYYLEETKAPAGYNKPDDFFKLVLTATTANNQTNGSNANTGLTDIKVNDAADSGDAATGVGTAAIENNKGSNLPETGGMGTTMLYAAGAAIVLIAGIGLAVTLRRRQA
ncbi:hypothetical protein PG2113B_0255 [Bifidobacterium pseudolongum subsp. globosum]|uniref:SpaA isopeptide-forming pilin-related protein n=1 Tax=Bifidobacterium pseudolongum TaxID=1694 RepID=UPI0010DC01C7|nr:SpaA isopeptide-forming pilin-related protein [Bifidobacterium pseudolongum]RYQ05914.1 hypothetical protein PG2113B_0255 [Bifidobacterium pseudolongum subsp. globosum]RYQ10792.1 hypothetical protein PG2098B_0254 [Bifidobacterium pseudolongum subsp. globosum]RYQ15125.1 hypothetical protein PG2088B_0254 [Bifidobacterium pseudolongum subsp. globosum]RYQ17133.1 hypothetical protein PG2086B_0254 [Bifidobacterium pseudolongum subsp. globosum]